MYSTGGIQLISADKFQISAGAFLRGKSGTEWWLQLLRTGVLGFNQNWMEEDWDGHGAWSRAVKLCSFLLAFPNISLQKKKFKKDIGWNKEQNNMEQDLKYPVYVLREI